MDEKFIKDIIAKLARKKASEIELSDNLTSDLWMDSLELVELVMSLEDHFDVDISDDDSMRWATVLDVLNYMGMKK